MSAPDTVVLLRIDTERALAHEGGYVVAVAVREGPGHPSRHVGDLVAAELIDALRPTGVMAPTDLEGMA